MSENARHVTARAGPAGPTSALGNATERVDPGRDATGATIEPVLACNRVQRAERTGGRQLSTATGDSAGRAASAERQEPAPDEKRTAPDERRQQPVTKLTEAQLTAIWRGRRFPPGALVTRQGVPVTVIYQGREGRGAGPDFRAAVIAGPSALTVRGDVELHVRASSFRAHGHERDPAYGSVILHVVFEDDVGADTILPGGRAAPVVALAPWVSSRAGELERWLAQPLLWREPCHDAVIRLGALGVMSALDAEGDRRFDEKTDRMAARIADAGVEQTVYEGLLEALGYGGNAAPMLALARILPWRLLAGGIGLIGECEDLLASVGRGLSGCAEASGTEPPKNDQGCVDAGNIRGEALLLGSGGLLPSQRGHDGPLDPYVQALEREFGRLSLPALSPSLWKLWGVRPENMPARRVAGAAALLRSLSLPGAIRQLAAARTVNDAIAPLTARASGYWLWHHDVCAGPCRLPPAFIGRSRALEILINVVLPTAAASGDTALADSARKLFAALPRPSSYGQTRFIESALASEGIRIPISARRAQGLLALNRDWCTQGGCGRCPLS